MLTSHLTWNYPTVWNLVKSSIITTAVASKLSTTPMAPSNLTTSTIGAGVGLPASSKTATRNLSPMIKTNGAKYKNTLYSKNSRKTLVSHPRRILLTYDTRVIQFYTVLAPVAIKYISILRSQFIPIIINLSVCIPYMLQVQCHIHILQLFKMSWTFTPLKCAAHQSSTLSPSFCFKYFQLVFNAPNLNEHSFTLHQFVSNIREIGFHLRSCMHSFS